MNKIISITWSLLLILALISMFIFVHEVIHVIRVDEPLLMCIGFEEGRFGFVQHTADYTNYEIFIEEVIANIGASVIVLFFALSNFYLILINIKGGKI